MKASDIEIGGVYAVKVNGKIAPVRINKHQKSPFEQNETAQEWFGTNLETGRLVQIRSPQRCRYRITEGGGRVT